MDQSNQTPSSPIFSPADSVSDQTPATTAVVHDPQNDQKAIQSNLSTSNAIANDQNVSNSPFPQPGQAASPSYDPQVVVAPHEAAAVPKETIGFSQPEPFQVEPAATPTIAPLPLINETPIPSPVLPPLPEPVLPTVAADLPMPLPPQPIPNSAPLSDDLPKPISDAVVASTDAPKPAATGEKSPLEILEEILAEANTEQSKEEDAKKKKEREDREFAEQLAAKEAAFKEQAAIEIDQKRQEVEVAKQRRDDVEADLKSQGRGDDSTPDVNDDAMAIRQLEHDKVQ